MIGWGVLPWGRDVIAITSVGGRTLEWSKTIPGNPHVTWRTAAKAMAALPSPDDLLIRLAFVLRRAFRAAFVAIR